MHKQLRGHTAMLLYKVLAEQSQESTVGMSITAELMQFAGDTRFGTVLADPPWRFTNRTGKVAPEHRRLSRYGRKSPIQLSSEKGLIKDFADSADCFSLRLRASALKIYQLTAIAYDAHAISFSQIFTVIEESVFALIRSFICVQTIRAKCSMLGFKPANSSKSFNVLSL